MKKSSSTSMISELLQTSSITGEREEEEGGGGGKRMSRLSGLQGKRNLSTSNASLPGDISMPWASPIRRQPLSSPLPLIRMNSPTSRQHRVEQLKKEESVDERIREVEQDREVTSQIHLNQSCVELKIDDEELRHDMMMETLPIVANAMNTVMSSPFASPSSPAYTSRVRSRSLTPTSPCSVRSFTYCRSLSPVPMRPSSLCFEPRKRKRNNTDHEEMDTSPTSINPPTAKRTVFASPLTFSPPLSSYLPPINHTHNDLSSFDMPPPSTTPFMPRPVASTFNNTSNNYDQSVPPLSINHHKRVGGNLALNNSHSSSNDSAFVPFKCTSNAGAPPTATIDKTNDTNFADNISPFHPVTTIS